MTKTYIGAKVVQAWPETEVGGKQRRGYAVKYAYGYTSWSPADVFEEAYREVPDDEAEAILVATRETIERLANGGLLFDAISADDESRCAVELRNTAVGYALESLRPSPTNPSIKEVIDRASHVAAYIENGVAVVSTDAIREAEQRGYDAARPLDPNRIELVDHEEEQGG